MKEAEMSVPHLFRCPISLDLFTDPVTLCTGQTYDRPCIEKWLAAGNLTCPVTMQKLHDPSVVPNHTLRHLIDQWLETGQRFVDYSSHETADLDRSLVASLKGTLESHEASMPSKLHALEKIEHMCADSPSKSSFFLHLGFMPLLLELVLKEKLESQLSQDYLKFLEQAFACALKLLAHGGVESLNMLKSDSKLASFLNLLDHGTSNIKISSCRFIEIISSSSETNQLCAMLGQNSNFLTRIVLLFSQNCEVSEAAVRVTWSLSSLQSNGKNLVREGAVDGLIAYITALTTGKERQQDGSSLPLALSTIEQLLQGNEEAKEILIKNPNSIPSLVRMLFGVSGHEGSESAVNLLTIVCFDSLSARERALDTGVLTQLLLLLQSQCTSRTKTKARMLLKMLDHHITGPSRQSMYT